jgi:hypothetical protein
VSSAGRAEEERRDSMVRRSGGAKTCLLHKAS